MARLADTEKLSGGSIDTESVGDVAASDTLSSGGRARSASVGLNNALLGPVVTDHEGVGIRRATRAPVCGHRTPAGDCNARDADGDAN